MIGNKIADKITSLGKTKSKEKENERQEFYTPPEKRQKIIDDLRLFWNHIKMEYWKITNLLGTTSDNIPRFITKKWVEVHDQSGSAEDRYKQSKQIIFKTLMLRSDLCDFSDACIIVKGKVTVSFNPRENDYNNDFSDDLFPDNIFPHERTDEQITTLHKKWSFPVEISSVNVTNPQETADLVTFTEEILNGKPHFLCSSNARNAAKAAAVNAANDVANNAKNQIKGISFRNNAPCVNCI